MEDINQNKDIETNLSTNAINETIAGLQAQIAELKNASNEAKPNNQEGYINYKSEETPIDEKEKLLLGADIGAEIENMQSSLDQYKGYFPTSVKEKIDYAFQVINSIPKAERDLEMIKNDLSFLTCKVFFDYEGVDVPDHLKSKVEKVKNATKYTASIKEEVRTLLPHLPYMQKNLQSIIDRKKNAGVDFDGFNSSKRNTEWYIKNYSQGATTLKEMQDYFNSNPAEKQRYHELIDNRINSFCQERGYKRPTGIIRGINNYTFGRGQ